MKTIVKIAKKSGATLNCRTIDIFNLSGNEGKFHLIYEKGCWHSFFDDLYRTRFAERVASLLTDNGLWISASGSADNDDDPDDPQLSTYPRLTLLQIALASEKYFEAKKIQKGFYGNRDGNRFLTWECLFQKRAIGIGSDLTVTPSHTTGHTDRVSGGSAGPNRQR